jgi:hypothetical protein
MHVFFKKERVNLNREFFILTDLEKQLQSFIQFIDLEGMPCNLNEIVFDNQYVFECNDCRKQFDEFDDFKKHENYCKQFFRENGYYNQSHICAKYICQHCNQNLYRKDRYDNHLIKCIKNNEIFYINHLKQIIKEKDIAYMSLKLEFEEFKNKFQK